LAWAGPDWAGLGPPRVRLWCCHVTEMDIWIGLGSIRPVYGGQAVAVHRPQRGLWWTMSTFPFFPLGPRCTGCTDHLDRSFPTLFSPEHVRRWRACTMALHGGLARPLRSPTDSRPQKEHEGEIKTTTLGSSRTSRGGGGSTAPTGWNTADHATRGPSFS
jgi:hypothetical protein